jgi:hypothetical protein
MHIFVIVKGDQILYSSEQRETLEALREKEPEFFEKAVIIKVLKI